ncbi:MAG: DEAD/DEAH box helicase [Salinivirgaceae bacterium]|nr:DEAD/DEAH box helicase [Salinivirgaceae bacterium]
MTLFSDLGLNDSILKAIGDLGFQTPTPIQEKTIPTILSSANDVVALAQTGTGKTAGFGLPVLQLIDNDLRQPQALVLAPTRELCLQIASDLTRFSKHISNLNIAAIYGGASIVPQIKMLKAGVQIVVGTPGRTLDVIRRGALRLGRIKWLVLDEADEMLNMGFKEDLDEILLSTPSEKQTLLFSATMPNEVRDIANLYMNNAVEIAVGAKNAAADNVKHEYYMVKAADRYLALKRLADINPKIYGIVFCRTRQETKEVADKLIQDGYNADALHGDLSQAQRDYVMNRFRNKSLQLLIATDVAARGLDVNDLTHVINYNLPDDPEVYIHRSGRTGRAGKSGVSMTIIHSRETRKIKELEKISGKHFELKLVPSGREICEKRLFTVLDKLERIEVDENEISDFLPLAIKKLSWLDKDELIKRLVGLEFNHFIEYYKGAPDLNVAQEKEKDSTSNKRQQKRNKTYSRFYINLGLKNGLNATSLIGLINELTDDKSIDIGKIDILRKFSFFEIEKDFEQKILSSFNGVVYENIPVKVEVTAPADDNFDKNDRFGFERRKVKEDLGPQAARKPKKQRGGNDWSEVNQRRGGKFKDNRFGDNNHRDKRRKKR